MEKCELHHFGDIEELQGLRSKLLSWYDKEKRELPWRTLAKVEKEANVRAYGVWVSEVMLQQTQVATVIEYYNKWMGKWPTVEALASATLEEVYVAWAGLGYYSRGRRLWEGARKVMSELGGVIPCCLEDLVKQLPGVGKYTAGAIASIAFNKTACIVDGNVARVMSRQRVVGGRSSCQAVTKHLWELAEVCVDPERPGDFNQALMEIGATVCSPRNPRCHLCPLSSSCLALQKVKCEGKSLKDERKEHMKRMLLTESPRTNGGSSSDADGQKTESRCPLCLVEWNHRLGVMNYPHKPKKKPPVSEEYGVAVLEDSEGRLCLKQRPTTGLLAGLWGFPSLLRAAGISQDQLWQQLHADLELLVHVGERPVLQGKYIGKVTHQFTHVHHLYQCWHVVLTNSQHRSMLHVPSSSAIKWISRHNLDSVAVSASVKKILGLLDSPNDKKTCKKRSNPSKLETEISSKKQKLLHSFSIQGKSHKDKEPLK